MPTLEATKAEIRHGAVQWEGKLTQTSALESVFKFIRPQPGLTGHEVGGEEDCRLYTILLKDRKGEVIVVPIAVIDCKDDGTPWEIIPLAVKNIRVMFQRYKGPSFSEELDLVFEYLVRNLERFLLVGKPVVHKNQYTVPTDVTQQFNDARMICDCEEGFRSVHALPTDPIGTLKWGILIESLLHWAQQESA